MRPKIIGLLLLAGFIAGGSLVFLKERSTVAVAGTPSSAPAPAALPAPPAAHAPPPPAATNLITASTRAATIQAEKERLSGWSMQNDRPAYSNILADLVNPEKEIRNAAIEAVKQFGDPAAIPVLKGIAANSDDTQEQMALLEAADFLSLPRLNLASARPGGHAAENPASTRILPDPRPVPPAAQP